MLIYVKLRSPFPYIRIANRVLTMVLNPHVHSLNLGDWNDFCSYSGRS